MVRLRGLKQLRLKPCYADFNSDMVRLRDYQKWRTGADVGNFNSDMVRLRDPTRAPYIALCKFQFRHGAIKSLICPLQGA